jgi:hypothetical protein
MLKTKQFGLTTAIIIITLAWVSARAEALEEREVLWLELVVILLTGTILIHMAPKTKNTPPPFVLEQRAAGWICRGNGGNGQVE